MKPLDENEVDAQFQEPIIPHYASELRADMKRKYCPVCRTENIETNRFCSKCGSDITQSVAYSL